jgi:hypothetical protein
MGRSFDGTNDNLTTADNSVPTISNDQFSIAFFLMVTAQPANAKTVVHAMSQAGAGNARTYVQVTTPTTAGFRIQFTHNFANTNGFWRVNADFAINVPHHFVVTYSRIDTALEPTFWANGSSEAYTEVTAPVGAQVTDYDTIRMGENAGGSEDLSGVLGWVTWDSGVLWTSAEVNRHRRWGIGRGGPSVATLGYGFMTDKLTSEGTEADALTASGTTGISFLPPVVRPGSMLGVGW